MNNGMGIVRFLTDDTAVNREELRARLRGMTNKELGRFGRTVRKMCSLETNRGNTPPDNIVIQLEEAWTEWISRFTVPPKHQGLTTATIGGRRDSRRG